MSLFLIAARSLSRNKRRTAIALTTVGFGVIGLLLAGGFIEWIFWAMRTSTIESQLGHIQVVRPGYLEFGPSDPFRYLLPEQSAEASAIEKAPGVKIMTPRLAFSGLISFGDTTISFAGQGVDPAREAAINRWIALVVTQGQGLKVTHAPEVILGRGLAQNLGAQPGDTVSLLVSTASGGLNAVDATVAGIFRTFTKAYDNVTLRVPISLARTLIRARGTHTWIVFLDETDRTDGLLAEFRSKYPASQSNLQFVPWHALADFYNKTVDLFSRQMRIVRLIVATIIVLSISNVLVMSVFERTGELGTLLALGHRRRRIMSMFLIEGFLLGTIGGIVGLLAGLVIAHTISAIGIPMPPPPGSDEGFTGEILVTWPSAVGAVVLAAFTTTLSALYPSWKASRLQIVDALRHNI